MAIGVSFDFPGITQAQYDEACERLNPGKGLTNLKDWPHKGIRMHVAGPSQTGWRVVDVWDSEADFQKFGAALMPIVKALGFPDVPPQTFPVHKFVTG